MKLTWTWTGYGWGTLTSTGYGCGTWTGTFTGYGCGTGTGTIESKNFYLFAYDNYIIYLIHTSTLLYWYWYLNIYHLLLKNIEIIIFYDYIAILRIFLKRHLLWDIFLNSRNWTQDPWMWIKFRYLDSCTTSRFYYYIK